MRPVAMAIAFVTLSLASATLAALMFTEYWTLVTKLVLAILMISISLFSLIIGISIILHPPPRGADEVVERLREKGNA